MTGRLLIVNCNFLPCASRVILVAKGSGGSVYGDTSTDPDGRAIRAATSVSVKLNYYNNDITVPSFILSGAPNHRVGFEPSG
jgi:hypothetical protein